MSSSMSHDKKHLIRIPKKGLSEGQAKPFSSKIKGKIVNGLVVCKNGKFFAYENVCQHLAVTLDLNDGNFFNHDSSFLQCHMHGALYELDTGLCVAGPCIGGRLRTFELDDRGKELVVLVPLSMLETKE